MSNPPSPPLNSSAIAPSGAQVEYEHLISYFKYLVMITASALTLIIGVGGALFYRSLKDVRDDATQEATRVATAEAKNRVSDAFEEKNINAMILSAEHHVNV